MKRAGSAVFAAIVLFAGMFFVFSCGGGGDSAETSVALFGDTNYVNFDEADNRAESSNVLKTLQYLGVEAVAFTGTSSAILSSALDGRTALAIPEINAFSLGNLSSNLDSTAVDIIHDFVESGGSLLIFSSEDRNLAVANTVFGFSMEFLTEVYETISLDAAVAAGTNFADAPSTLSYPNQVTAINSGTLPVTADRIYSETQGNGVLTLIPYGSGHIICLGWDWDWADWTDPATPISEGDDGGWFEVLSRALEY